MQSKTFCVQRKSKTKQFFIVKNKEAPVICASEMETINIYSLENLIKEQSKGGLYEILVGIIE